MSHSTDLGENSSHCESYQQFLNPPTSLTPLIVFTWIWSPTHPQLHYTIESGEISQFYSEKKYFPFLTNYYYFILDSWRRKEYIVCLTISFWPPISFIILTCSLNYCQSNNMHLWVLWLTIISFDMTMLTQSLYFI